MKLIHKIHKEEADTHMFVKNVLNLIVFTILFITWQWTKIEWY